MGDRDDERVLNHQGSSVLLKSNQSAGKGNKLYTMGSDLDTFDARMSHLDASAGGGKVDGCGEGAAR